MTEYSVEKFYDEYALKKEDTIIAVIDTGTNARKVCDLLNEQEETILKQKRKIKELEEENGRMKGAFKRKFDYDIEEVVDEICDEDW